MNDRVLIFVVAANVALLLAFFLFFSIWLEAPSDKAFHYLPLVLLSALGCVLSVSAAHSIFKARRQLRKLQERAASAVTANRR